MSLTDKIKGMLHGHQDQAQQGMDKAARMADEKTGGRYSDQIDTGERKLGEQVGTDPQSRTDDEGIGRGGQS